VALLDWVDLAVLRVRADAPPEPKLASLRSSEEAGKLPPRLCVSCIKARFLK
jgi:hypothetical protein